MLVESCKPASRGACWRRRPTSPCKQEPRSGTSAAVRLRQIKAPGLPSQRLPVIRSFSPASLGRVGRRIVATVIMAAQPPSGGAAALTDDHLQAMAPLVHQAQTSNELFAVIRQVQVSCVSNLAWPRRMPAA